MQNKIEQIIFGPVPSRRLGQSLGINNIPPKSCSYSCIYCQVGETAYLKTQRQAFYEPSSILKATDLKLRQLKERQEIVDYLTFVADGEPTLDTNLGKHIELLKLLGKKIAVITNSSLIWQKAVQDDLSKADLVSVKIDSVDKVVWHKINRPQKELSLEGILNGIRQFSEYYKGELITETMLVRDINDTKEGIEKVATFISEIKSKQSYISIPTRPPALKGVKPPAESTINTAYQIFKEKGIHVETITGFEGNNFGFSGNVEENLLGIASVHPMREESVRSFLKRANADQNVLSKLLSDNKLKEVRYKNNSFYVRKLVSS